MSPEHYQLWPQGKNKKALDVSGIFLDVQKILTSHTKGETGLPSDWLELGGLHVLQGSQGHHVRTQSTRCTLKREFMGVRNCSGVCLSLSPGVLFPLLGSSFPER